MIIETKIDYPTNQQKPLVENTAAYCFIGEIERDYMGDGNVVVGNGCDDAQQCINPIEYTKLNLVENGNHAICNHTTSLKSYFTPLAEVHITELSACYNPQSNNWQFSLGNNNEISAECYLDFCPTNIQNMGETLIEDVHNFPNNYGCWKVKRDINKHRFYGLTISGTNTLKSILRAHEYEHKKDFEVLYEKHKEYYLNTAEFLLKPCEEFVDENTAKAFYEPTIRGLMKQIYRTAYRDFQKLGGSDGSFERGIYEITTNWKIYPFIDGLIMIAEVIYCP